MENQNQTPYVVIAQKKKPVMSIVIASIGMITGVIVMLFGFTAFDTLPIGWQSEYTTVREVRFGADFYTEIYAATRAATNNLATLGSDVTSIGNIVRDLTIIPISIGAFMLLHFALKLSEIMHQAK